MASPVKPAAPWVVKLTHEAVEQGLPAEKIRQKLVLEGAEPDVIDHLLLGQGESPVSISPPIEPSSPCASPQRRQLSARRFHEMLLVGLPPASVRQKMAMEGLPTEDINGFFAAEGVPEVQNAD
eukprot:g12158.t1